MILSTNRKAKYEYNIIDEYDAGIVLHGSEVKSLRQNKVNLTDCFIYVKGNNVWIKNLNISPYKNMHSLQNHSEKRDKKLLLTKKQIKDISKELDTKGNTCITLSIFTSNNKIKVKIATAKGKKLFDKRRDIKNKDIKRDLDRVMKG